MHYTRGHNVKSEKAVVYMDFRQSETQTRPAQATAPAGHPGHSKRQKGTGLLKLSVTALLYACTILFVAVIAYMVTVKPVGQDKYIDSSRYQAIFLNGGQVYFGRITSLNNHYTRIADIYYLQVNQQVQPNQSTSQTASSVSLVKLGCELHGPQDSMVINQDQVIFWENLKSDGKVAQAIAKDKKENPTNGIDCTQNSSNSSSSSSTTPATTKKQ